MARRGMDRIIINQLGEWIQPGMLRCVTVNPELFHSHKKTGNSQVRLQLWKVGIRWRRRSKSNIRQMFDTVQDEIADQMFWLAAVANLETLI